MISCYLSFKLFKKLQVIIFPLIFFLVKKFQDLFLLLHTKMGLLFQKICKCKTFQMLLECFFTQKIKSDILSNFFFLEGNWCKTLWVAFEQTNEQQLFYICKQTNNLTFAVNCLNQKLKFLHQITLSKISVPLNLNISSSKSN